MTSPTPRPTPAPEVDEVSPDVLEQHQRADGSLIEPTTSVDPADRSLSPDEIEQRQDVVDPDDFDDDERSG